MKLSRLSFAALAVSAAAAHAQNVEHLSGATAPVNNIVLALNALCPGGNMILYKVSSGTANPGNIFTARCTNGNFTGTLVQEARFNTTGGSIQSVLASVSGAVADHLAYLNALSLPVACSALPAVGSPNGTGVLTGVRIVFSCGATSTPITPSLGGYSDVEGPMFQNAAVPLPLDGQVAANYILTPFNQAFGVAASKRLYEAMQEHQTAQGRLPIECAPLVGGVHTASGSSLPLCQPSISRADYAALSVVTPGNVAKRAGANFLIGGLPAGAITAGNPAAATFIGNLPPGAAPIASPLATGTKRVYLCRRVATSGTQAASLLYFLNRPTGQGPTGGQFSPVGFQSSLPFNQIDSSTTPAFTVRSNSGSGNVVDCVNGNPLTDADPTPTPPNTAPTNAPLPYALGVLSLENNPVPTQNYRFLKINGQFGSEGVAGASQTAESINGRYDFWYQLVKYCPQGVCASITSAIDGIVPPGAASPGLFRTTETAYTRGGASNVARTK